MELSPQVEALLARGVQMPNPAQVTIDALVDLERIASDCELGPGTCLRGAAMAIGPRCRIGTEGPVTLDDCCLGADVTFGAGFAKASTFLTGVEIGSGAHIRPGCLLEERASVAHTVGLKQTVLMPHVVIGSLVNFCDCLLAGGTGRQNHSEVGSSYIHFNFTPQGDKATASLLGDVPQGVMLNQPPIFLGGQGGLVGPLRLAFGTVIAAGTVYRRDVDAPDQLVIGPPPASARRHAYRHGLYGDITRKLRNSLLYIGNLHALREWYRHVRPRFMPGPAGAACHEGAMVCIERLLGERAKRLADLGHRMARSLEIAGIDIAGAPFDLQRNLLQHADALADALDGTAVFPGDMALRDTFLEGLPDTPASYVRTIQSLPATTIQAGTAWLQSIVQAIAAHEDMIHG